MFGIEDLHPLLKDDMMQLRFMHSIEDATDKEKWLYTVSNNLRVSSDNTDFTFVILVYSLLRKRSSSISKVV